MSKASTQHPAEAPSLLLDHYVGRISYGFVILSLSWVVVLLTDGVVIERETHPVRGDVEGLSRFLGLD